MITKSLKKRSGNETTKNRCLGFSGSELDDVYWKELDALTESGVLAALPVEWFLRVRDFLYRSGVN